LYLIDDDNYKLKHKTYTSLDRDNDLYKLYEDNNKLINPEELESDEEDRSRKEYEQLSQSDSYNNGPDSAYSDIEYD
jgi:hypothetical protein